MKRIYYFLFLSLLVTACNRDDYENLSLGLRDYYNLPRFKKLELKSPYEGSHQWILHTDHGDSLLSTSKEFFFIKDQESTYNLEYRLDDGIEKLSHKFTINVHKESPLYQSRVTQVFDYRPAPGQFVNIMPKYVKGDTQRDMNTKVLNCLRRDILISLGAFGGYVVMGFDHSIYNKEGADFYIKGNSFYSDMLDPDDPKGGSSESGIVYVSMDRNKNGLPDDEWYELKGSVFAQTDRTYEITYSYPTEHEPVPDGMMTDTLYCPWKDNRGHEGHVYKNQFHNQSYYPEWIKEDLVFHCSKLPSNAEDKSGSGTYWVQWCFDWGYVDNHPNAQIDKNSFDISNAVDKNGLPVHLPCIDFVKVQTGQNQYCGWLGETSTEFSYFIDLNLGKPNV